jgi:hypothetical protein
MLKLMNFDAHVRSVFADEQEKLNAFSKLMMDAANGEYEEGITAKEANEKIIGKFYEVIGVDKTSTKAEIRKAIKRNQQVLFDLIEEIVPNLLQTGWQDNPFFNEFVETKNIDIGDQNVFYTEDETILSVSKVSGNHWDIDRQRLGKGASFSVETSWYGIAVYSEYERLLTGAEDFATFITKLYEAVDKFVNESIYQAMLSASAQLPGGADGNGQWVKTGALDKAEKAKFMQLIEDVQMATGMDVVIMGTKTALSRLEAMQDINWVSNDMKVERNTTGRIGYFEGIRLVEIKQGFRLNDTTNRLVDDKQLLIMPVGDNKFIKVVNEGNPEMRQVNDNTVNQDMTYDYRYMFKLGVAVMVNLLFGVYNIATA